MKVLVFLESVMFSVLRALRFVLVVTVFTVFAFAMISSIHSLKATIAKIRFLHNTLCLKHPKTVLGTLRAQF